MENGKLNFNRLGYENYETWKLRARQFLTREGLWKYVTEPVPPMKDRSAEWNEQNELAVQTIGYLVEDAQLRLLKDATTAQEAWSVLRKWYSQDSSVGKVSLIKKLSKLELPDGGDMRQYLTEMDDLFEKLENTGAHLDEDIKGAFMLANLPESYQNTVSTIQGRMEVFSVKFVKTKLLEEYGRRKDKTYENDQGTNRAMLARKVLNSPRRFDTKRECYACGSEEHLVRDCGLVKKAREESRGESSLSDDRRSNALAARVNDEPHVCFVAIEEENKHDWFLDSGVSVHMTGKIDSLKQCEKKTAEVTLADGKLLRATVGGSANFNARNGINELSLVKLSDVLYVPGFKANLVSVNVITSKGFEVVFKDEECYIMRNDIVLVVGQKAGKLYKLNV